MQKRIVMNPTWLDRHRHTIFIGLLLSALSGIGIFYFQQPVAEPLAFVPPEVTPTEAPTATPPPSPSPTPGQVRVYITGAIVNSDVYFLPQGSIIKDVILAAGGLSADADAERINQAQELKDQQQIHVPRIGEVDNIPLIQEGAPPNEVVTPAPNESSPSTTKDLVNINTATLEELDTLPGIGPALGQRIIDYREQIGGFKSIEAIIEVSGIGDATFAKFEALITVE
jgi:competence protein ComEA